MSCYANATCQFLLNNRHRFVSRNSESGQDILFDQFTRNDLSFFIHDSSLLTSNNIRNEIGGYFTERAQQDAQEFLIHICDRSENISSNFDITIKTTTHCCTCLENTITANCVKHLRIHFINDTSGVDSIDGLLRHEYDSWETLENSPCTKCHDPHNRQRKTIISECGQLLIVHLILFGGEDAETGQPRKCDVRFAGRILNRQLCLNGSVYELNSVVCHIGQTLHQGHYYTWLKSAENGLWSKVNDSTIREYKRLPAQIRSPYLMIFHRI